MEHLKCIQHNTPYVLPMSGLMIVHISVFYFLPKIQWNTSSLDVSPGLLDLKNIVSNNCIFAMDGPANCTTAVDNNIQYEITKLAKRCHLQIEIEITKMYCVVHVCLDKNE